MHTICMLALQCWRNLGANKSTVAVSLIASLVVLGCEACIPGLGMRARAHCAVTTPSHAHGCVHRSSHQPARCHRIHSKYGDKVGSCFPELVRELDLDQ
jgi:hypothetical protein